MMSGLNLQRAYQRRVQQLSFMALGAIITLGSCTASPTASGDAEPSAAAPEDSLQVVTTFLPITQFTKAVVGDRAEVVQLLPTNLGPHDFQAKPSDVQAVATADVLVKNGLEMEFFLDDLIENAANSDLVTIDSSEDIVALTGDKDGHSDHAESGHDDHEGHDDHDDHAAEKDHDDHDDHEGHDDHAGEKAHAEHDDHEGHDDHEDHDDHAGEKDHHGHVHGEFDPHIWLDPKRAVEQVENIRDGLIAADPAGEAEYTANAAAFITELQALDADITEMLSPFAGRTFVVFHDFAAYFAQSYGMESEVLVGLPEENPSPEDVKRVMETVQSEGLKTIMTEPQAGDSSFKAIAQDLSIGVSEFDPLEVGPPEAIQSDYYLTTMRQNAENLANSFSASPQSWYPFWMHRPVAVTALDGWL